MIRKDHGSNEDNIDYRIQNILTALREQRIISLFIEPASACNLKCNFCDFQYRDDVAFLKQKGIMKLDTFTSIIDDVRRSKYSIDQVNFFLHGESLVNKRLPEMVAIARTGLPSSRLRLTTNGELLTLPKFKALVEAGIDEFTVSVDTLSLERYKDIKKSDRLPKLLANVDDAVAHIATHSSPVQFNIKCVEPRGFHGLEHEDSNSVIERFRSVAESSDRVHVHICNEFSWYSDGKEQEIPKINKPCEMPFYQIAINYDGVVSACCLDITYNLVIGKIGDGQSFDDIVESRALKDIRLAHLSGDLESLPACQHCDSRTVVDVTGHAERIRELIGRGD